MTSQVSVARPGGTATRSWPLEEHPFQLRGASHRLRLVRLPVGWLASVDSIEGPTLGCDRSPYLALSRALEPIGGRLIDAMSIVAELHLAPRAPATEQYALAGRCKRNHEWE